jgi:hypothetical protein
MPLARIATLAVVAIGLTGCYHVTVDTGLAPSGETIEIPWAHSFIAGLVPPETVDAAEECPSGVSRVESQLSFLNMVANVVTFGIYSPMQIDVQCAAGSAMGPTVDGPAHAALDVPADAPVIVVPRQ